jgi:predicted ribosome quality control (RQC) complex YloA/Tae2 family protein
VQPFDFTTLTAVCQELRTAWLPARLEQVYQRDRFTVCLALRTLEQRGWLTLCWHPQAARLGIEEAPPRQPDTFTFSQQLRHQLGGLALIAIEPIAPWERALDLQFARRPGDSALWHLYVEIMGQYSNVILANQDNQIVTAAHQVSAQQSRVRPIQTGQPYEFPPALTGPAPNLAESQADWQARVSLIPGELRRNLIKTYRGLSSALATTMLSQAKIPLTQSTTALQPDDWQRLFGCWQIWLQTLESGQFQPGWTASGYTVMGWNITRSAATVQILVYHYYRDQLNQQVFAQLRQQIQQKLTQVLEKLGQKATGFRDRLQASDQADQSRQQADLLMAHLHLWTPGMHQIELPDFATGEPITILLNPEKNAVYNAQLLYKKHQKLKRSRAAIVPLLTAVEAEINYLEQIEVASAELVTYQSPEDLEALEEIRDELIQQGYLAGSGYARSVSEDMASQPHRYTTPGGFELWVGRNNRQNDQLTFRQAGDYDLWFHTQEIPGSHVLLRLTPGSVAEDGDLQFAANVTAYYSRARQSEQVPVVYTEPKHVYKPKGAKPGMAIYKHERILWGQPQRGQELVQAAKNSAQ